jgi:hypothetical protein
VVQPLIDAFSVASAPSAGNPNCTLAWDCRNNPAGTIVSLEIVSPAAGVTSAPGLALQGTHTFSASQPGTYVAVLRASLTRNGETRHATQALQIAGV